MSFLNQFNKLLNLPSRSHQM